VSASYWPLLVMSIVAPIGAIDVLYFHLYKFRLHAHRASQLETATHLVRGLLFAIGAFLMTRYELRGAWFWVMAGVFAFDFLNNVADVILEPKSRAPLGGLPPLEYAIHIVGATASGSVGALWIATAHPLAHLPTALVPGGELPSWLATNGYLLAAGTVAMVAGEGALLVRALSRRLVPAV
jgi:hypothetical protein